MSLMGRLNKDKPAKYLLTGMAIGLGWAAVSYVVMMVFVEHYESGLWKLLSGSHDLAFNLGVLFLYAALAYGAWQRVRNFWRNRIIGS